ncbi:MAG: hypothetical protein U0936_02995 [Planctomycetaceae bacterium]
MIGRAPLPLIPVGAVLGFGVLWTWLWWRRRTRFAEIRKSNSLMRLAT